jgi:hypothetical protein
MKKEQITLTTLITRMYPAIIAFALASAIVLVILFILVVINIVDAIRGLF